MPRRPEPPDPLQRSLFDDAPAPADAAAPTATRAPGPPHAIPGDEPAPRAAVPPAARETLPPQAFRHPQAQREVRLSGHLVAYALRRARRRSIGFVVGAEGLSVSAPRWVALGEIEAALQAKADWILRKLHEQRDRARRLQDARIDWRDGTGVPFLGETVIVVLDPWATGAVLDAGSDALPGVPHRLLHVGLPQGAAAEQIRDAVQAWLQRQARRIFDERCALYAAQLGVRVRRLTLSSASTRWGSANADGSIRLNWRLVHFGLPIIDYVVAHELAHLREMNHSPAFWEVVRSVLPEFHASRQALRDGTVPVFD